MNSWQHEIEVAVDAAKQAGALAIKYQHGIQAETKSDLSPVTHADRECELLIMQALTTAFPDDGVMGEEGAARESKSGRRWIIDPIDGTRDYVRGNPLWATLIGLEQDGEVVAGVVSLPLFGGIFTGAKGAGAFHNGERMRVSAKSQIGDSVLCFNGFNKLKNVAFRGRVIDWAEQFWAVRSLGGAPDAMLVGAGHADAWVEPVAAPWDLAPLKVILEEAGALFFNFDGGRSIYGGNCVACVPGLEAEMKRFVGLR